MLVFRESGYFSLKRHPSNRQIHDVEVVSIRRQQIAQDTVVDGALGHMGNLRDLSLPR